MCARVCVCVYTLKPKMIQTPDIIFDIVLLMGSGHYSQFI